METGGQPLNNSDEISLKDVLSKIRNFGLYLVNKRKVLLLAFIIGGLAGLVFSFYSKPIYRAKLTFALEEDKSPTGGLGAAMGIASQFGIDIGSANGGGAFLGDNLLELMQSRLVVEKTLLTVVNVDAKSQTLAELYILFNHLRQNWNKNPELRGIQFLPNSNRFKFTLKQDSILGIFYRQIIKNNLTVSRLDKKSSIITVLVESNSELFSKCFAEALTNTVSDFYIETKTKKSAQNVTVLQRQTDSVRRELNLALMGTASSADVNPNPNPTLQILRVPYQKRQVDVQANQAILAQLVANLEMAKISLRKETPLIQLIDTPILPLEIREVGKIKGFIIGGFISILLMTIFIFFDNVYKKLKT